MRTTRLKQRQQFAGDALPTPHLRRSLGDGWRRARNCSGVTRECVDGRRRRPREQARTCQRRWAAGWPRAPGSTRPASASRSPSSAPSWPSVWVSRPVPRHARCVARRTPHHWPVRGVFCTTTFASIPRRPARPPWSQRPPRSWPGHPRIFVFAGYRTSPRQHPPPSHIGHHLGM